MSSLQRSVAVVLVAAVVSVAAMYVGAWWMPFLAGLAIGAFGPRARFGIPLGAVVGLGAWTLPLLIAHAQYGLGPTATAIAAIMGLTGAADLPVALTVLVGTLLGASGAWLGSAAHAILPRTPLSSPPRGEVGPGAITPLSSPPRGEVGPGAQRHDRVGR